MAYDADRKAAHDTLVTDKAAAKATFDGVSEVETDAAYAARWRTYVAAQVALDRTFTEAF